ncbi:MAG TPA: MFS transporter [Actinomycetota bacterium]|nr:MFS transporter [Actinomycetota bacterium]
MSDGRDERGIPEDVLLESPRPHPDPGKPPRLLAIRPFLWLVLGEVLANIGLWAFFIAAEGEAVFGFGASPSELGIVMSAYSLTFIPAAPAFGFLADRWSPKRLLVMAHAGAVAIVFFASMAPSIPWLVAAMALFGLAEAVVWPARGALVPLLVDEDRLVQANGMMGLAWQVPLVIGPALAAVTVRTVGPDGPYFLAMAAIAASVPLFALVPDRRKTTPGERERFFADLAGGFREAWQTPILRALLIRAIGAYLLLGMAITLEALYVREVLDRGQDFLGVIFSVTGAGSALGSLALVALKHGVGREHVLLALGLFGGGLGYVLYVATDSPVICLIGSFLFGAGFTFFSSPAQALIQRVAARPGKVTAVYAMLGEGGPLVAALLVAALGGLITVQPWLIGSAVLFTLLGLGSLPGSGRRGQDEPAAAPAEEPVPPA